MIAIIRRKCCICKYFQYSIVHYLDDWLHKRSLLKCLLLNCQAWYDGIHTKVCIITKETIKIQDWFAVKSIFIPESGIGLGISLIRKDCRGMSQIFIQDVYTGSPADKDGRLRWGFRPSSANNYNHKNSIKHNRYYEDSQSFIIIFL